MRWCKCSFGRKWKKNDGVHGVKVQRDGVRKVTKGERWSKQKILIRSFYIR